MKTKWILLHLYVLILLFSGCATTKEINETPSFYASKFEDFVRGEKGFFETFEVGSYSLDNLIKGTIVEAEPIIKNKNYPAYAYEWGMKVVLDNGKSFLIYNSSQNSVTYNHMKSMLSSGYTVFIEAFVLDGKKCAEYTTYDKNAFDRGIEFYKTGKKKKNIAECSLNVNDYPYNRFYGGIKNAAKSRVYDYVLIYFGTKSIELVYLENGEVLCINNVLKYFTMKTSDIPSPGKIINYISSNMDGYCGYNNVYFFKTEDFY